MSDSAKILLVFTNLPNSHAADQLAAALVERRLAACVNQMASCKSIYRWQNEVQQEEEVPLLIKTTASRYAALEAAIHELHPYELPEIIAVDVAQGLPGYLDWVVAETTPE